MKIQMGIEYVVYCVFSVLAVALLSANLIGTGAFDRSVATSSCSIVPGFACYKMIAVSNGISSSTVVEFGNRLNSTLVFPDNSFVLTPVSSNNSYSGSCRPSYAISGSDVVCVVSMNKTASGGELLNSTFSIGYSSCINSTCSNNTYSVIGTGSVPVTYQKLT